MNLDLRNFEPGAMDADLTAFAALSAADKKLYRDTATDLLAAELWRQDSYEKMIIGVRADVATARANAAAAEILDRIDFIEGLNLGTMPDRIRFFRRLGCSVVLTAPAGHQHSSADPETAITFYTKHKLTSFRMSLPSNLFVAMTSHEAALDVVADRHDIPPTMKIYRPNGSEVRLFSSGSSFGVPSYHSPAYSFNWHLVIAEDDVFGPAAMDPATGHFSQIGATIDGWLRDARLTPQLLFDYLNQ